MAKLGKVIVVGGGVGGLSTALALQKAGIEVEVHERHRDFQRNATGFTLWSYAVGRLMSLGVTPAALDQVGAQVEHTEIRNQQGTLIERMPVGEISAKLGAPTYEILRAGLLQTLASSLGDGVLHMSSEGVAVVEEGERVSVVLADGSRATGDLIVGADGIHSIVRKAVVGETPLRYSGYGGVSAVTFFSHPLLPPRTHVDIWGHDAKAGVADLGHGRVRWYVTHKAPEDARFSKSAILDHLAGWFELAAAVVEATPEAAFQPSAYSDIAPLRGWFRGRIVLLGDAAHATTPFAAMGANMTIEDAATLAPLLLEADTIETALQRYEASRKKRTEDVVKKGRLMSRLTQLHSSIASWLRDQAFLHMSPEQIEKVTREMASGE